MDDHIPTPWHAQPLEEVYKELETSQEGLSDAEAEARLKKYGRNELRRTEQRSIFRMLWEQLTDVMVLILIAAAALSAFWTNGPKRRSLWSLWRLMR